ncbi:hypothetical protein [Streptomyces cellulosae]|uniref:Uncharacterized protein n=1 Tax=Streptomyces cellulosae TaxID=1968 RepID=A0ABW7YBT9_STRCE
MALPTPDRVRADVPDASMGSSTGHCSALSPIGPSGAATAW